MSKSMCLKTVAVALTLCAVSLFLLAGCISSPKSGPLPTYCKPEVPLLLSQPYTRLYVEIDRMEGVEIPKEALDDLKDFLIKYCRKPDGVEMVYSNIIPQSEFQDRSPAITANLFIDGPPPADKQAAYLYVLIYDSSKMNRKLDFNGPHVNFPYASMIYYDVAFMRLFKYRAARNCIIHEAGHVLGLCKNKAHGDGGHCANDGCIMHAVEISISRTILQLPFKKQDLCADCRKDLEMIQTANPASNMSYNGPFLVRQEDGYWVASLSVSDVVSFSGTDTFDWQEALAALKKGVRDNEASLQKNSNARLNSFTAYNTGDSPEDINKALAKLARAKKDDNVSVRIGADQATKAIEAELKKQSLKVQMPG